MNHRELASHPAAWKGQELMVKNAWTLDFSAAEIAEIDAAVEATSALSRHDEVTPATFTLPTLQARLREVQQSLEQGPGVALLRGLPVDSRTENEWRRLFLGLSSHIGTPVSQSASGEMLFSVRDAGFADNDPRSRGPNTRKKLTYHTDRCDVIGFCCVQQAKSGGESYVVSSMALYLEIQKRRPDLLAVLEEPFYYARHNVDLGNAKPWCRQPIFSFYEGHFASNMLRMLIDRAYAMPELPEMTDLQREALDFVQELAHDQRFHFSFMQRPGDLLFLNNWVTLHRRSEFDDHAEPERKRHLLRVWLSVPNSRPLNPLFKDNYGATEAGAIRGGMHKELP
ncbi:MAG: alpha-ketoglutarate-dependent taurine dioxygenase [Verrucomicrobiales bacterium]|jgi:alpha-ketoglutarate-dependent taurine dioxygenase